MPAKKKEERTARLDLNAQAAKKSYDARAAEVQKRKLVSGLLAGKRRPTAKTLAKYNLTVDDKGELIIPPEYLPQPTIKVVPQDPQQLVVKGVPAVVEKIDHTMKQGPVTSQDVYDYITQRYNDDRIAAGKKPIEVKKLGGALKNIFKKLGFVKTYAEDIMPFIRDHERTLARIAERAPSKVSATKDIHHVFNITKNVPMVRDQVPISLWKDVYGKQLAAGNQVQADTRYENLTQKKVYKWNEIVKAVAKTFGKWSEEYLFFKVFEEAPIRTELANIPIVKATAKGKGRAPAENYLLLSADSAVLHLNSYKTVNIFGPKQYKFTADLVKLVNASLQEERRDKLFAMDIGINSWLRTILAESGFPHFPYGPGQSKTDAEHTMSGLRHTFAAFCNSPLNKGEFPEEKELADLMCHKLTQSLTSYRNKSFFTQNDIRAHKRAKD